MWELRDVSRLAPPFQEKYKLDEAVNGEDSNGDGTLDIAGQAT